MTNCGCKSSSIHVEILEYVCSSSGSDHGDHVSGTIMGAGNLDPDGRGMADGSLIHPSALDHEKLRWIMAQGKPAPEVVLVTSTQYVDNSKNSQSLSSVTSVNTNAGSNVSVAGQGFYE